MKKIITTLLIMMLVISLIGCNEVQTSNNITPFNDATPIPNNVTPTPELAVCYTPTPNAPQVDLSKYENLYVTGSTVNVRKEPSTDSEVITALSLNTLVKGYVEKDGWYYISVNDNTFGYMSIKYLSKNRVPTTREEILVYKNLPQQPEDADPSGTTYEMISYENYLIDLYKEKITQVQQMIKNKNNKIGTKVDALVEQWNKFTPNNTIFYYDLVEEFEPGQGTIFNLTRVSAVATDYHDLLKLLENIYLMMNGFESYIDEDAEKAKAPESTYKKEYDELRFSMVDRHNKIHRYIDSNPQYSKQAEKVITWHQTWWTGGIVNFLEIKWEILDQFDFSKNKKTKDFYKTFDYYNQYNDHAYLFKEIDLIMHGETTFAKG